MEATRTKSGAGFGQSWRELSHTPTYQVPVVLGSIVALLVGILTYVFDASAASKIGRAHPCTPVPDQTRRPDPACHRREKHTPELHERTNPVSRLLPIQIQIQLFH